MMALQTNNFGAMTQSLGIPNFMQITRPWECTSNLPNSTTTFVIHLRRVNDLLFTHHKSKA